MKVENGKFYFIKDEFFDIFKDYKLMQNKESGNKRPCYFCFNDPEKEKAFLIQNIFPTTEEYIESKYQNKKQDVEITEVLKREIIQASMNVIKLAKKGINIPFYDILEMKKVLLKQ